MNLVDALKTGRPLARPIAKHKGSNGDGWLASEFLIGELLAQESIFYYTRNPLWIDRDDLLADDWEVKE